VLKLSESDTRDSKSHPSSFDPILGTAIPATLPFQKIIGSESRTGSLRINSNPLGMIVLIRTFFVCHCNWKSKESCPGGVKPYAEIKIDLGAAPSLA
jgi:hypothetical protein